MEKEILMFVNEDKIDIEKFFHALPQKTQGHCQRVANMAVILSEFAEKNGMCDESLLSAEQIRKALLYHDIGFVMIPERLINKVEELTSAEKKVLQRHSSYGGKILERFRTSHHYPIEEEKMWRLAAETAISHHERWDGKGYPYQLLATAIPLISRITAIVDSYDAIVSGSAFRMSLPHEYALLEIVDNSGKQFDPQLVQLFLQNVHIISPLV